MTPTSILIVEDEGIVAMDLEGCLTDMGYVVAATVATGEEAILHASEDRPDLVLMDIMLKGKVDGIEAAQEIRARFNIPVVFLTAYPQDYSLDRIKATEPFGYLTKPVGMQELRGTIETALYKHQIETRLRESEEKYRKLVDLLPDGIYVDKVSGIIELANQALARILGAESPEELIGRCILDMVHPDYHESFKARMGIVYGGGEAISFLERKLIRKDGSFIDVEIAATPFMFRGEKCAQVVVRDITERKRAEAALKKSEIFLSSIIEQSPISMAILDETGTAIRHNQACRELFEVSDEEILGKYNIFKDKELNNHGLLYIIKRVFQHGESVSATLDYDVGRARPIECSRPSVKPVEVTLFPVKDPSGKITHVVIQTKDVAKIKEAESALKASESRFRRTFEISPVMMHSIDSHGFFRNVNKKWLTTMGYEKDEVIGGRLETFLTAASQVILRERLPAFWVRGSVADQPYQFLKKDGSIVDALVDSVVVEDSAWGKISQTVVRDVTREKQAEKELRESEEQYRTLFERAGDGILIVDAGDDKPGRIVSANSRAAEMHGYTVEEIVGLDMADLDVPEVPTKKMDRWKHLLKGEWIHEEHYHYKKDGAVIPMELSAGLVEIRGRKYMLSLGRDRTERHRARDLLIRSERLKAVAELSTGVAHNFNNMLQIVLGGVQLALMGLEKGSTSDVRNNLQEVLESCRLGAETVKRLQEFARARPDRSLSRGKVFDVARTVEQAVEMSKPWWKTNPEREGIKISLHRKLSRKCMVKGRESEIFEVILNLLKNSIEALPTGGEMRVRAFRDEDWCVAQIQDNGVGISSEHLGKVFEPFWTTKGYRGTGMGLASSYGIVTRHGGDIQVESQPGLGALFTVRLPLAGEAESDAVSSVDSPVSFQLKILVVDDMEPVVRQLETGLKKAGQSVLTALSGEQAVKLFQESPVDLIVCDLGMPGMNGWEVGKAVKKISAQRGVPRPSFIILTGWGGQEVHAEKIAQSGIDQVIQKPINIPNLLETIKEVIEAKRISR